MKKIGNVFPGLEETFARFSNPGHLLLKSFEQRVLLW